MGVQRKRPAVTMCDGKNYHPVLDWVIYSEQRKTQFTEAGGNSFLGIGIHIGISFIPQSFRCKRQNDSNALMVLISSTGAGSLGSVCFSVYWLLMSSAPAIWPVIWCIGHVVDRIGVT